VSAPVNDAATRVDAAKADALLATMQAAGSATDGDRVTYLEQLEGGFSRHTYGATVEHEGGQAREYIVRVRPLASTLDTDLGREFRTFALLEPEPVPTPAVHGCDESVETPFGGAYFVMDRMQGHAPNVWRRRDREQLEENWEHGGGIAEDLVRHMATIHSISAERGSGAALVRDFEAAVDHWQGIYEANRLVRDPVVDEAFSWVRSRQPDPVEPCLVHGDYRIGNCLTQDGHLSAILDWELSYVGDPRFDLGYMSLEYHAGKFTAPGSKLLNAVADREWFYGRYTELTGRPVDVDVIDTFTALGGMMLFSIMTTGLRVYSRGETSDIKMAWTRFALPGVRQDLTRLMRWNLE
jgi:aminoglycoside phosphotransferase (APT) family kinase protein